MTDRQGQTLLVLLGTMFAQVGADETTRKISKVTRQIRRGVVKLNYQLGDKKYSDLVKYADSVWEAAKADIDPDSFKVSLALAMSIAYSLLEEPYKTLWFTEKNFDKALGSLEYGFELTSEVEEASQWLITKFEKELKLNTKPSRFSDFVKTLKEK